jgi:hypothetical protein
MIDRHFRQDEKGRFLDPDYGKSPEDIHIKNLERQLFDKDVVIAAQAERIEELVEGIRTISQIRRTNLWATCIDCDNDRCDHGAPRDLIMQQVAKLLREVGE